MNQFELSREDLPLLAAFLISLTATLGALFIGEGLGQMPCNLFWDQRIAMFPLMPILGLSLWCGEGMAYPYALPLVVAGSAHAGWRSGLYLRFTPEVVAPCTRGGPSCLAPAQIILGRPIPYLSLAAFAAMLVCLILPTGTRAGDGGVGTPPLPAAEGSSSETAPTVED